MKQVDIKSIIIPNRPRSGNYPTGSTVIPGGDGSNTTIINQGGGIDLTQARKEFLSKKTSDTANGIIDFLKGIKIAGKKISELLQKDSTNEISDEAIMTAARTLKEIVDAIKPLDSRFLRKDKEDATQYLLKLLGGIISPYLQSPVFVPGAMGAGFTIKQNEDHSSYAEVDKLLVRKKAIFQLLEILKTELGGSSFLFNASGARATLTKVEKLESEAYFIDGDKAYFPNDDEVYFPDIFRCYFTVDDGDTAVENLFKVGDFVRSQTFNIEAGIHEGVSNHYWWRLVVGKGKDYIDISSVDMDEGSDEPAEGDVIVQLGNIDDIDRQAAIVVSAYGDGAPSLTMYQGIDSYSLAGKDIFSIGYDRVNQECFIKIFGSGFWGARDETSFLRYNQKTKKFDIKANVEIIGGFNDTIAQSIGYSDYKSLIEEAAKGKTIMKGGYINLEVLDAKTIITSELIAAAIKAKALEIGDGKNINSKIDTDGSATFRNVKAIKGQFEDVVVKGSIRSSFEQLEDSFSSDYSDNIVVSGGGSFIHAYVIPSGIEHIGRKMTICCTGSGYASFTCPKGDFYEYGKKTSELLLNKEVVQVIGYGLGEEFYGWIVTSRNDLDIKYSTGRSDKVLAKGIIDMRGDMQKYYAYDGKQLSIVTESKKITVTMPSEWGTIKDDYMVMITPLSRSSFSAGTYYVNVKSDTVFEILYMGEGTGQGGAAFFEIKRLNFI